MPDYKIGGYHPIHVGEVLIDRYVVIQKLGWGHFSTVWLCKDLKFENYVAIKVQKSAQHYLEAAYDEVDILDQIATNWKSDNWKNSIEDYYKGDILDERIKKYGVTSETSHCAQLLNSFIHHGPNGKHFVMVFEILGVNFLELIKRYDYKGVPIPLVRILAKQCLIGLDYMHRMCNVIHTDFKPENVVISLTDAEVKEISKTGQLTTTKMTDQIEIMKRLNMKVVGTTIGVKNEEKKEEEEEKDPDGRVWAEVNMDGLTAKQKKTLRKKLAAKRRKQKTKEDESKLDESKVDDKDEESECKIEDVKVEEPKVQDKKKQQVQQVRQKKRVINGSLDMNDPLCGKLLLDDDDEDVKDEERGKKRGKLIDKNVQVKICDMGNGCWTYHHFTPEIQTRQYRSPEVIIGSGYDTSADIWSFACTIFEMITGDFLFEPRKGANYDKDDDHLAQMMELLGRMPKNLALSGKQSSKYFDSNGGLRNIRGLNYWPLSKVLMEKYRIKEGEAVALADFLIPMITWYPHKRATAKQMLKHPWFDMPDDYDYRLTDREIEVQRLKKELQTMKPSKKDSEVVPVEMSELIESDEEVNGGDDEGTSDNDEEVSFIDSEEERAIQKKIKVNAVKINNSFTGPYPIDPTDFNHKDKGPNAQFEMMKDELAVEDV